MGQRIPTGADLQDGSGGLSDECGDVVEGGVVNEETLAELRNLETASPLTSEAGASMSTCTSEPRRSGVVPGTRARIQPVSLRMTFPARFRDSSNTAALWP